MMDSMQMYLAGTCAGFVLSFTFALVGSQLVADTAWFGGDQTGPEGSRIDWRCMWGLLLEAFLLPTTFCFGGAFALAVFKYPTVSSKVAKVLVLTGMEACFVFLVSAAWDSDLGLAKDVLECGIFGCYAGATNDATKSANFKYNYRVGVGVCLFAPALAMCVYIFLLVLRVGADVNVADAVAGLGERRSLAGGGGGGHKASGLRPSASADKNLASNEIGLGMMHEALLAGDSPVPGSYTDGGGGLGSGLGSGGGSSSGSGSSSADERRGPLRPREGRVTTTRLLGNGGIALRGAALLGGLVALLVATAWVPQNWESLTRNSLIAYNSASLNGAPELEGAVLTTQEWTVSAHKLVLHFFPDCLVFYGFLAFLASVGTASHLFPRKVGAWLQRRVLLVRADPSPRKWWWDWVAPPPLATTRGGLVALGALIVALALHFQYWINDHAYHGGRVVLSNAQVAARVLGQTANFVMGLMLLPVAKNSVLTACFGIAWEQVIFVHVFLGQVVLMLIAAHALCWWKVYYEQSVFPQDVLQVPMYFPLNSPCDKLTDSDPAAAKDCFTEYVAANPPDSDNFTIQMATIVAVLLMVCMGRFARYSTRRANYELFYYLHHAFLAAFSVALLHAASSWYYLVGGLVLWFVDRCLRALNRARRWCVLDVSPWPDGVTRLEIAPLDDFCGRSSSFAFAPGQYLYLNLPCLGPHEWHPFTISSAPSDGVVTCHIKAAPTPPGQRKNSTWTGRLHDLAVATAAKRSSGVVSLQADGAVDQLLRGPAGNNSGSGGRGFGGAPLLVSVDGPFGACVDVDYHDDLLLLGGGIGFTPIHSIVRQVRSRMLVGGCGCRRVHVMLAVQRRSNLDPFLDTLQAMVAHDLDGRCVLSVYVDNEPGVPTLEPEGGHMYMGVPFKVGKLNPVPEIRTLGKHKDVYSAQVFVCGPPGLAATADAACLEHGVSFHKEVFAF